MLNRIILMGRLVADPELKSTQSGVSVAIFRIAVERNYTPQGQERQADFISCVAWRQTAEFISKYFAKGRMIALEGSLQSRNYEDKQGQKRTAYEVIVDHAYFADSKPEGTGSAAPSPVAPPPAATPAPAHVSQPEVPMQYGISGNYNFGRDLLDVETDDGDLPF